MKNILLMHISLMFLSCTVSLTENKKNSEIIVANDIQLVSDEKQINGLSLVFDLPIKKNGYLEVMREDNWDYPKDFQVKKGILYILSGEEKKIIGFDTSTKQFLKYDKINQRLLNEKENNTISSPIFLRFTNDFIVVCYDFKLLVFSLSQEFIYKINFDISINYVTIKENTLNLWHNSYVEQIDLQDSTYVKKEQVNYGTANIDFADIMIQEQEKIATQNTIFNVERNLLSTTKIKYTPYNILPEVKKESFSLNCITPTYYVWYPWAIGSKIVLINKESGVSKIVNLGFKLTENTLFYEEDRESGLKIINDDDELYFMVMVLFNGQKSIRVYHMRTN